MKTLASAATMRMSVFARLFPALFAMSSLAELGFTTNQLQFDSYTSSFQGDGFKCWSGIAEGGKRKRVTFTRLIQQGLNHDHS